MTTPPWSAVIFDLDGTLADTIPLIVASYQHAFRSVLGQEVDETRARAWIGRPLLPALLEESPEHGAVLDAAYREWNLANTARLLRSYAGVPEMLRDVRAAGVTTGVVTSKRRETALVAIRGVGIEGLVDLVGTLESTDRHKPAPDPLLHGAAALGVDPARCAYVGDAVVDMAAAHAAGMAAVAVTWGAGSRSALERTEPAAVVETVGELSDLLAGRGGAL